MGGLLHLVQRGGAWAGCGLAQALHRCTKCNSPPVNGQCTNFILCGTIVALNSKGLMTLQIIMTWNLFISPWQQSTVVSSRLCLLWCLLSWQQSRKHGYSNRYETYRIKPLNSADGSTLQWNAGPYHLFPLVFDFHAYIYYLERWITEMSKVWWWIIITARRSAVSYWFQQ